VVARDPPDARVEPGARVEEGRHGRHHRGERGVARGWRCVRGRLREKPLFALHTLLRSTSSVPFTRQSTDSCPPVPPLQGESRPCHQGVPQA
jgi:hypothetical protein